MSHSLLVKSYLMVDSTNSWLIDFRAIGHICNSLQGFQLRRRLNEGEMYQTLASTMRIVVQAVEDVTLVLENNKYLELKDCFYVLDQNSLLYQNTQPFYVEPLVKKNQRKSHYDFCNISGIVLKDWLMEIVNNRINELHLFKS